ncbi:hypothetical protein ACH5RR_039529 [Cinchona calisaya]|uniref:Uncharacterized protein n=1 Tax=Cinchona calisaya TaxID=153742 RepID=A0ABD2XYH9_9GENT
MASSSKGGSGPVLSLPEFQVKDTSYFHQSNFVEDLSTDDTKIAEVYPNSWPDTVKAKGCVHEGLGLNYMPHVSVTGDFEVQLYYADVEKDLTKWKHAIIGQVLGIYCFL